jgi:hypothetical protein
MADTATSEQISYLMGVFYTLEILVVGASNMVYREPSAVYCYMSLLCEPTDEALILSSFAISVSRECPRPMQVIPLRPVVIRIVRVVWPLFETWMANRTT